MALTVTGQLTMPDGTPLAGAEVHLTAKRNEATSIVTGVSSFFTTGSNGQYSQQIESGYYAVSISYSSVPGADPRRWSLGDIWVEDGDPISINALLSLDQSAADPANAALQQMLADAQQARDEAVQAAQDAQEAVDGVPEVGTGPDQVPTNSDLGSAAYTESSAYASAAQGQLAEDAQPKEAGKGLSANDFTNPLKEKLESLEGTHWRGQFTSLSALESGVVDPKPGDYADVDVAGAEARRYIWDETDQEWVAQSGVVPPLTASQVKQLYESNPDTNAFDDEDKNKLDSIDPSSYAVSGTGDSQVRTNSQLDARYAQRSVTVTPLPATSESFYGLQAEDGQRFSTTGWHDGTTVGGASFVYDASRPKSDHDGGTVISPTVPPLLSQNGATAREKRDSFIAGGGEEDPMGSGCFVRVGSGPLNAVEFGCFSDGFNDDTLAVQTMFSVASESRELCYFPSGRYLISSPVDTMGCSMRGDGMYKSTIVSNPETPIADWIIGGRANDVATFYARNHSNWTASQMGFDGRDAYTGGLVCTGGRNVHYHKLYAKNFGNAPFQFYGLMEASDSLVSESSMTECVSEGSRWNFVLDGALHDIIVSNNISKNAVSRHISLHIDENQASFAGRGITISNNICTGHRQIPSEWLSDPSRNRSDAAIRLRGGSQALFVNCFGNTIRDWDPTDHESTSYVSAITTDGQGAYFVHNNYIHDINRGDTLDIDTYGIRMVNPSNGTKISDNIFLNVGRETLTGVRAGIYIDADVGRFMFSNNMGNAAATSASPFFQTSAPTIPTSWGFYGNMSNGEEADLT